MLGSLKLQCVLQLLQVVDLAHELYELIFVNAARLVLVDLVKDILDDLFATIQAHGLHKLLKFIHLNATGIILIIFLEQFDQEICSLTCFLLEIHLRMMRNLLCMSIQTRSCSATCPKNRFKDYF